MGNKMCTIPPSRGRQKKLEKIGLKTIAYKNGSLEDEEVYLTPKTHNSNTDDQDTGLELSEWFETDSTSPNFVCEICDETKALHDSFYPKGCVHFFCSECVVRYVASKLDDNLVTHVSCPITGCLGVLDPEICRDILPKKVFDRWGVALCEYAIDDSKKFYCPYKDCSALLINDAHVDVVCLDCPYCKRAICVKCKVVWHSEMGCTKFQKLRKKGEDAMLVDLAKRKKWRKCPKCKVYVEKSAGCFYVKCRCGYAFCYRCGARSSTTTHVCPKCKH